jgi:hypothetical protein
MLDITQNHWQVTVLVVLLCAVEALLVALTLVLPKTTNPLKTPSVFSYSSGSSRSMSSGSANDSFNAKGSPSGSTGSSGLTKSLKRSTSSFHTQKLFSSSLRNLLSNADFPPSLHSKTQDTTQIESPLRSPSTSPLGQRKRRRAYRKLMPRVSNYVEHDDDEIHVLSVHSEIPVILTQLTTSCVFPAAHPRNAARRCRRPEA